MTRTADLEDDRLETDVHSRRSSADLSITTKEYFQDPRL